LKGDIIHYGYRNLSHFIEKLNGQTNHEAQKWVEDKRKAYALNSTRKMCDRFSRNYFRKKGSQDGFLGYLMSVFHGVYQLYTYAKYKELKGTSE